LNHPTQVHPEPRIGFAWQPFSSKDLVLRGGYGIYANRISFEGNVALLTFNPPFVLDAALNAGANAAASLQNPFPNLPPTSSFPNFVANMLPGPPFTGNRFPRAATITDPDFKESTVQQFDLDLQVQHKSYVFSIAYAGAKGTHLALARSNNQPLLADPSNPVNGLTTNSVANVTERVPFVGLAPLIYRLESSGNSIYNSLQATLKKDLTHGFQFLAAYTFSNPLMMRPIVSVHLSVAHSEDRSWGKWCTTIRTVSVLSGASLTLTELSDWLSAVPGPCPVPGTRQAQLFKSSEMAGALRVSSRCNPDSLSAS